MAASSAHADLAETAGAFVTLQEARHEADYDLARAFTKREAINLLGLARDARLAWSRTRNTPDAERFVLELLVGRL